MYIYTHASHECTTVCAVQINIKVIGTGQTHGHGRTRGSTQLLKVWLPGVVSLAGDHSKAAVAKHTNIASLLDAETGLRIRATE